MSLRIHNLSVRMARAYLIESDGGLVLVDSGAPRSEVLVLRKMRELGRSDLKLIFITHAHLDHYGGAAAIRRRTGAPIAVHGADVETMARGETPLGSVRGLGKFHKTVLKLFEPFLRPEPAQPDIIFGDGDSLSVFGLDAVCYHTPGHTPGSSCLLVEGRWAFVGDLLSTNMLPHTQLFFANDWSQIPESLSRVKALTPETVYTGHGRRPMSGEALQRIECR